MNYLLFALCALVGLLSIIFVSLLVELKGSRRASTQTNPCPSTDFPALKALSEKTMAQAIDYQEWADSFLDRIEKLHATKREDVVYAWLGRKAFRWYKAQEPQQVSSAQADLFESCQKAEREFTHES